MATAPNAVWAIDIGNSSLKALRLTDVNGEVEVLGFDNIQHAKVLTGNGIDAAERDELIALSLRQFVTNNYIGKDTIVIAVPSQNSFARFVSLPPVEDKRIPEIVKYEAAQQIPFDINEVQWDWQLMSDETSAEKQVGIFAIKNDVVTSLLDYFGGENLAVSYVQMTPMALYNYILHDRPDFLKSDKEATVILNIGAENTDLVVCTKSSVWQRCIPRGGNAFTRAIADTFKLNFEKAEKLKRKAAMSKYARQIFQAMKPVFSDLASEIQRSLGFYTSSNPKVKLTRIIAFGGGTKMRGLLKYLQQSLQIPIEQPDSFKKLTMGSEVSEAKFHENVDDFGVVYGLALQGLGLARIEINLLPRNIARSMAWSSKTKYFTVAACMLFVVSLLCVLKPYLLGVSYDRNESIRKEIKQISDAARQGKTKLDAEKSKIQQYQAAVEMAAKHYEYRDVIPVLHQNILSALPNADHNPEQAPLYKAFDSGDISTVLQVPRKERKQIFITHMAIYYAEEISIAQFGGLEFSTGKGMRGGIKKPKGPNPMELMGAMGMQGMPPGMGMQGMPGLGGVAASEEAGPGFIVTIAGYSPYANIYDLLDPAEAGNDKSKWGFVTRLMKEISDSNSQFEIYKKTNTDQFKLEIKDIAFGEDMPVGIGIVPETEVESGDTAVYEKLIDPMTKEIISKVPELDDSGQIKTDQFKKEIYKINDHWFSLDVKFVWKKAPGAKKS